MALPSPSSVAYQQAHIDDDRRGGIVAVNVLTLIIAYAAVFLRYYSRRIAGTTFGPDDGWICAALLSVTLYVAGLSTMVHYGFGRHSILITNPKALVIATTITAVCYNTGNASIKISILFLYRRIFPIRWLRFVLLVVGAFALGQWLSFNFVTIFQCIPFSAQWEYHRDATCVNYSTASFISGILNVITDILILASPMHTVWHLKVSKARKRLITLTFSLGGIVSIISIVRLAYIRVWGGDDHAYNDVPTTELSGLEIGVGTLAACLPVYRPLYNRFILKTNPADTTDKHSTGHGSYPRNTASIRLGSNGGSWSSNVTASRSDEEPVLYPRQGRSTDVWGVKEPRSVQGQTENEIVVTRQFVMATSGRDLRPEHAILKTAHDMSQQTETCVEDDKMEPIAIIGFSARLPQDADTTEGFWRLICEGRSAATQIPKERFNIDAFYHPDPERIDATNVRTANFLRGNIAAFDAPFFSIQPTEVASMDPQQRLLLEESYKSLENEMPAKYVGTGIGTALLANRISWFYDLRGPSVALDTACSSGLTAVHLACQSLRSHESSMALAGGCNLILAPDVSMVHLSNMGFFSPDGQCYSFDERANGYAKGEGVGVLVLKRLTDALKDGDSIRAVIRASGANQDGRTPGITQPSQSAQEENIRETYHAGGLGLDSTEYFEAHGTGTQIGDATEAEAIGAAFEGKINGYLSIGALKPNIGHLESASGIASLIKTVLILENGLIPPNIFFEKPNARILTDQWRIQPTPWPTKGLRRASVNSFGYGGSNAHLVLDDACNYLRQRGIEGKHRTAIAPPLHYSPQKFDDFAFTLSGASTADGVNDSVRPPAKYPQVCILSAADEDGVHRSAAALREYLLSLSLSSKESSNRIMQDLAYTLSEKRTMLPWKSFVVAGSIEELLADISTRLSQPVRSSIGPSISFVFTGQGAQWAGMGQDLERFFVFRSSLEKSEECLRSLGCGWSLLDELQKKADCSDIDSPEKAQPICTAIQIALVDLLAHWGIYPTAIVGHSSGEIAAGYCAYRLSHESAIRVAFHRGSLAAQVASSAERFGGMISVALSEDRIAPFINQVNGSSKDKFITVGCVNSPKSVTVTGDRSSVNALNTIMDEQSIFARKLPVSVAYHSDHMQSIAAEYSRRIGKVSPRGGSESVSDIPIVFSSVTGGRLADDGMTTSKYWENNLVSPVQFSNALQGMTEYLQGHNATKTGRTVLLEIGPTSALQRPVKDTIEHLGKTSIFSYDTVLKRNASSLVSCLELIGRLRVNGHKISLMPINSPDASTADLRCLTNLPPYAFNHSQSHWTESRVSKNFRMRKHARHELLGAPVADWNPLQPRWRNIIRVKENPWILDHQVNHDRRLFEGNADYLFQMSGSKLYPASGMITMVIEGMRQLADSERTVTGYRFSDVSFKKALPMSSMDDEIETQLHFDRRKFATNKNFELSDFVVFAYLGEQWSSLCEGTVVMEHAIHRDQQDVYACPDSYRFIHDGPQPFYDKKCRDEIYAGQFYQNLARYGFQYGSTFQLLQKIRFNQAGQAKGTIDPDGWQNQSRCEAMQDYVIHPTALDCLGQICMAAISDGSWDAIPTMVPTRFTSLWISNGLLQRKDSELNLHASVTFRGYREADFAIVAQNSEARVQIAVEGWRETALDALDRSVWDDSRIRCHKILWKPDPALLASTDPAGLPPKLASPDTIRFSTESRESGCFESLETTSMFFSNVHAKRGIQTTRELPAYLHRHIDWILGKVDDHSCNPGKSQDLVKRMLEDKRYADEALRDVANSSVEGDLLVQVGSNFELILAGKTAAHEILLDQPLMTKYLHSSALAIMYSKLAVYLDLLAHKKPDQRILEVNAGDGALTDLIVDTLVADTRIEGEAGVARFSTYDFTDPSHAFFGEVEDRFQHLSMPITYKTLDAAQDTVDQGFEPESYDIVVGRLFLHPHPNPEVMVGNLRKLLRPDQWQDVLVKTLHTGTDVWIPDSTSDDSHVMSMMITTAEEKPSASNNPKVTIVVSKASTIQAKVASRVVSSLGAATTSVCEVQSMQDLQIGDSSGTSCVFLLDMEATFLRDTREADFAAFKKIISSCKGVLWVSRGGGKRAPLPETGLITGLGRNILSESWDTKFIELSLEIDSPVARMTDHVTKVISIGLCSNNEDSESEFREQNGRLHIGRVVPIEDLNQMVISKTTIRAPKLQRLGQSPGRALALTIESPGLLETLHFKDDPAFLKPLADDEVEIKVRATGMNFKDVVIAMGQLAGDTLGYECAGTITRAGRLSDFQLDDRVCCCTTTGAYKTFARAHATSVAKIPEHVSYSHAAAVPLVFCTAHYSLISVARLQAGESVLIHSAAGGVGQAAVMIAKQVQATIYATVSTEEKKTFLIDRYQIPESHIFSSRTRQFAETVMQMTGGVDVVLNSLSGELLRASWSCVAPFGRFVELGKSDINSREGLPMSPFNMNVTFASVDLGMVMNHNKAVMASTLKAVMTYWGNPDLQLGASSLNVYKSSEIEQAFRKMQSGTSIGKIVIEMDDASVVPVAPTSKSTSYFDPCATYVITGGFGGLGPSITRWMADRNARNFIVLSRSGAKSKSAIELLEEMENRGIRVEAPPCDIANGDVVSSVFKRLTGSMPPIKGCIQASMVLKDGLFENTSLSDFDAVLKPKFQGSWNLHLHLPSNLDFFVLLSSVTGVTGARAQAAYAAGNTFQNTLARHRVSLGQKCISLDLGPVSASGVAVENDLIASLEAIGLQTVGRNPLFALLDHCCDANLPLPSATSDLDESQIITGLGGAEKLPPDRLGQIYWTRKPLFSILRHTIRSSNHDAATQPLSSGPNHADLLQKAASASAATELVTVALIGKVAQNLNVSDADIDAEKPIYAYGIDSLVALEVRYWFSKEIGADVTIWEIMQARSLGSLAELAAGRTKYRQEENKEQKVD
ncbi:MAG: hypothetical protein Q9216_004984 [Gyalolechia sp. 2 TL-2023]